MEIFNIDSALKLPQSFDVLHNSLDELYKKREEAFQKDNPLLKIYKHVKMDRFEKSFGSSLGFSKAFERTSDYATYPGFTSADGFKASVNYQAYSGKLVFSQEVIDEVDVGKVQEKVSSWQLAWHRQQVEFGMYFIRGFFGGKQHDPVSRTFFRVESADTVDGDPMSTEKNPIFTNAHNVVRTEEMSEEKFNKLKQSNKFYIDVTLDGSDPLAPAKLANGLYQIFSYTKKYKDDNGKLAGVSGKKTLVMTDDAGLNSVIDSIMATEFFQEPNLKSVSNAGVLNQVRNKFEPYYTAYIEGNEEQEIPMFAVDEKVGYARGILMLDKEYNDANNGPMMLERKPLRMRVVKTDEPEGMKYLADQKFSFACPNWRGVGYIHIGKPAGVAGSGTWDDPDTFTEIVPVAYAKAVKVI